MLFRSLYLHTRARSRRVAMCCVPMRAMVPLCVRTLSTQNCIDDKSQPNVSMSSSSGIPVKQTVHEDSKKKPCRFKRGLVGMVMLLGAGAWWGWVQYVARERERKLFAETREEILLASRFAYAGVTDRADIIRARSYQRLVKLVRDGALSDGERASIYRSLAHLAYELGMSGDAACRRAFTHTHTTKEDAKLPARKMFDMALSYTTEATRLQPTVPSSAITQAEYDRATDTFRCQIRIALAGAEPDLEARSKLLWDLLGTTLAISRNPVSRNPLLTVAILEQWSRLLATGQSPPFQVKWSSKRLRQEAIATLYQALEALVDWDKTDASLCENVRPARYHIGNVLHLVDDLRFRPQTDELWLQEAQRIRRDKIVTRQRICQMVVSLATPTDVQDIDFYDLLNALHLVPTSADPPGPTSPSSTGCESALPLVTDGDRQEALLQKSDFNDRSRRVRLEATAAIIRGLVSGHVEFQKGDLACIPNLMTRAQQVLGEQNMWYADAFIPSALALAEMMMYVPSSSVKNATSFDRHGETSPIQPTKALLDVGFLPDLMFRLSLQWKKAPEHVKREHQAQYDVMYAAYVAYEMKDSGDAVKLTQLTQLAADLASTSNQMERVKPLLLQIRNGKSERMSNDTPKDIVILSCRDQAALFEPVVQLPSNVGLVK